MTALAAGILWLQHVTNDDASHAGVYGVKLGEMQQAGFPVAKGFIITSLAYFHFLRSNNLLKKIPPLLSTINFEQPDSVMQVATHIQKLLLESPLPETTVTEVTHAYNKLTGVFKNGSVSLHFSPTGMTQKLGFQTIAEIHGETNLLLQIKKAWATNFTPQALIDRHVHHIDHFAVGIAITVQQQITADISGVMLTTDPVGSNKNHLIIEAVDNDGTLDHYTVDKTTAKNELREKRILNKKTKLTEDQIRELAEFGKKLETFLYFPQEIHWAIHKGSLYFLDVKLLHFHELPENISPIATKLPLILKAIPASRGIKSGFLKYVHENHSLMHINHNEILLLPSTVSLSAVIVKQAAGLIIEKGSRTSPTALMAREYGIPTVITQTEVKDILKQGMVVTIDGTKGWIYKGSHAQLSPSHTATKIFTAVTSPESWETPQTTDGVVIEGEKFSSEQVIALSQQMQNHPVIYRMFDPQASDAHELLGLRGAYRSLQQPDILEKELKTLQLVQKSVNNLWIMLPFVRNISELTAIKHHLAEYGLTRSGTCKLWIPIETPSNVHLLEEFIRVGIDGVSIDSDNLTMLYLGTDKNNSEIAHTYDGLDASVLSAMEQVITTAHKHAVTSSVHGHSVSNHSSLIEKLVAWGITNIVAPSQDIDRIKHLVKETEQRLINS